MSRPSVMAERSLALQELLRSAGYSKGSGVSTLGIRLVSHLAKARGLRDWPDTLTPQDYDALIAGVRDHLNQNAA